MNYRFLKKMKMDRKSNKKLNAGINFATKIDKKNELSNLFTYHCPRDWNLS